MRIEQRRGPFRTLDMFFEQPSPVEIREMQKRYARISLLTHSARPDLFGFRLKQKVTPNIHLEEGIDAAFRRYRDTVRNEIRRTECLPGFEVRIPDPDNENAYRAYRAFEFAQGRAPISRKEFGAFVLAGAYLDGRFISGVTFFRSGGVIRIRSIFSLRLGAKDPKEKELYKTIGFASKRLIYEICAHAVRNNVSIVDLASINLTDPSKASIAHFKSGFGAAIENEYQYLWSSQLFQLLERFAALRSRFRILVSQTIRTVRKWAKRTV